MLLDATAHNSVAPLSDSYKVNIHNISKKSNTNIIKQRALTPIRDIKYILKKQIYLCVKNKIFTEYPGMQKQGVILYLKMFPTGEKQAGVVVHLCNPSFGN